MEVTTDISFYETVKRKLGYKESHALIGFIDHKLITNNNYLMETLATKQDLAEVKSELKDDIANVKLQIAELKTELKGDIREMKADIRWLYTLIIPILLGILGLYLKK